METIQGGVPPYGVIEVKPWWQMVMTKTKLNSRTHKTYPIRTLQSRPKLDTTVVSRIMYVICVHIDVRGHPWSNSQELHVYVGKFCVGN